MFGKEKEQNILTQRDGVEKVIFGVMFAIFTIQILTILVPLGFMLMNSFKGRMEFNVTNLWTAPKKWLFKNWGESFKYLVVGDSKATQVTFIGMVWNSLWQTCVRATILSLTPMLVGYVYARYDFYGKKAVMAVHLFTMTLPLFGSGGAYMKFIHDVGLFDSPLYFILTSWNGRSPSVFIYSAAFTGLSHAYKEAAELDGASRLRIFFAIEARMTAPIFWTFFINNTFGLWNDYLNVLLYQPSYTNLSTGLYLFGTKFEKSGNMHTPVYWCGLIIGSIPPLVLFGFSSDLIFKNMALGGLKG
jgi:ABC-type glycerol-3-phosphate transport system permease component